jgi:AraC family transcriptional regulator
MEPKIETLIEKKFVGKRLKMTFAHNRTNELWQSFMPRRREIRNKVNDELISMQVNDRSINFAEFNVNAEFEKWAAIEVSSFDAIPDEMETFVLPGGLYAVFHYKGLSTDTKIFQYIFGSWLPASNYMVDNRPHFEILGEKYRNNDPNSEEEIWIPIKPKILE